MLCWLIPALTGLISWLVARSYYKKSCQYDCQLKVDKVNSENRRLKEELDAAQLKIKAASNVTSEAKVYNSAAFDEGMQRLVKIQEDAKATTIENIDVAPAQSFELGKLKADMKIQNETANTAKKVAATTGLAAAAFAATDVKSDFLTKVVGKDATKMKADAVKISKEEAELAEAREQKAKLAKEALAENTATQTSSDVSTQTSITESSDAPSDTKNDLVIDMFGSEAVDNADADSADTQNTAALAVVAASQGKKADESALELSQKPSSKTPAKEAEPTVKASSVSSSSHFLTAESFDKKTARAAIGKTVKFDDLTVVEGIGPKIAGLFKDASIATWRKLSETSVSRCQKILDEAGPRYRVHKPDTWPEQAKLAAKGEWETLAKLQDELDGGRKA